MREANTVAVYDSGPSVRVTSDDVLRPRSARRVAGPRDARDIHTSAGTPHPILSPAAGRFLRRPERERSSLPHKHGADRT